MNVNERTCARFFKTTSGGGADSSLLMSSVGTGALEDVVGSGALGFLREVVVNGKTLERETATLVGVMVGIEEVVEVVCGRLEGGVRMEVGGYVEMIEDESEAGCIGSDESPFQTNWQESWDKALSKLSQN